MDPRTLPAEAQELYRAIKAKHSVGFEQLRLADDIRLHLLKITDLEPLLDGKDPLDNLVGFPFWVRLWEAAVVLARFLVSQRPTPGSKVLELGAGLSAPGLAAAALGYEVTLTDYEPIILDFAKVSAAASGLDKVRFELLDWLSPPEMERYDIILGAEIIFREALFEPLLNVMRQALKPGGVIYLAHDSRRQSLRPFLAQAEKEYTISVTKRTLKSLEENREIILTRLTPR